MTTSIMSYPRTTHSSFSIYDVDEQIIPGLTDFDTDFLPTPTKSTLRITPVSMSAPNYNHSLITGSNISPSVALPGTTAIHKTSHASSNTRPRINSLPSAPKILDFGHSAPATAKATCAEELFNSPQSVRTQRIDIPRPRKHPLGLLPSQNRPQSWKDNYTEAVVEVRDLVVDIISDDQDSQKWELPSAR